MKSATIRVIPRPLFELVIIFFVVGIVVFNTAEVNAVQQLGLFATFGLGALRLLPALTSVISCLSLMKNTEAALQKYFTEKDNLLSAQVSMDSDRDHGTVHKAQLQVPPKVTNISVNDIHFRHDVSKRLLESIRFNVCKGQAVGVVVASGSGKSTLVSIILGLLKPTKGEIKLDGVDIEQLSACSYFSYLPQIRSSNTLCNNIVQAGKEISTIKNSCCFLGF